VGAAEGLAHCLAPGNPSDGAVVQLGLTLLGRRRQPVENLGRWAPAAGRRKSPPRLAEADHCKDIMRVRHDEWHRQGRRAPPIGLSSRLSENANYGFAAMTAACSDRMARKR